MPTKSITFNCEIITPMFIGNAMPGQCELRPSAIKGALRFWWRAMNGDLPLIDKKDARGNIIQKGLGTIEAEIFGSADEKIGRSQIVIEIIEQPTSIGKDFLSTYSPQALNRAGTGLDQRHIDGVAYLLYSTFMLKDRKKQYFEPGTDFKFRVIVSDDNTLTEFLLSLQMLLFFGGIGTRSRRGAGSFRVKSYQNNSTISVSNQATLEKITKLHDHTSLLAQLSAVGTLAKMNIRNDYSFLKGASIYINPGFTMADWRLALEKIGKFFKTFRKQVQTNVFGAASFGFPIQHSQPNPSLMIAGKNNNQTDWLERRSSPLFFKILKVFDGASQEKFLPIIIHLNGELIPVSQGYKIRNKKSSTNGTSPSSLNSIKNSSGQSFFDILSTNSFIKTTL